MEVDHQQQQQQQQQHQDPTPTETTSTVEAESSSTTTTTLAQDSKAGNGGDDNVVDDKNDIESAAVVVEQEENLELEEANSEDVKPKIDDVVVADDSPSTFPSGAVNQEQKPSTPISMPPTTTTTTTTTPITTPQKSIALQKEQFKFIQGVLRGLKRHPQASPFLVPVDPVALNIPNYTSIVLCPSDLQSIQKKMDSYPVDESTSISTYTPELFEADVRLIFSNCLLFNGPENPITKMSFLLEKYFNNTMAKMPLSEKVNTTSSAGGAASFGDIYTSPKRIKRPPAFGTKPTTPKGPVRKALTPEMQFCSQILKELTKKSNLVISWPFLDPVDPVKLNIPDYFSIIKNPMDLNKVRSKLLDTKEYSSSDEFEGDIRLIISNCLLYNGTESDVATMCRGFERLFDDLWATKPDVFPLPPPPKRQQSSQQSGNMPIYQQQHHQFHGDSDSQRIFELNNKIQVLQAELNGLLMRSAGIVSPAGGAGAGGYLSPSGGSHSSIASATSHTSSSAPKRSRKKPSAAPRTSSPSVSGRAASASATPVSEEQFLSTPMTFEEKSVLSQQVNELDPDRLGRVVEIIQAGMSLEAQGDSDVIELDIESLPVRTLRELQRFVLSATKGITDLSAMLGGAGAKASNVTAPAAAAVAAVQASNNDTRPAGMISSDDEKDNAEEDSDEDSDEE